VKRSVLIIVENMPVPLDGRVWKEALALRAAGYQVSVLCPRGKGCEKGYEFMEGVHVYRHPIPREKSSVVGHLLEFVCALLWEFVYSWWIYFRRGFAVIQGCNPPDDIFLVALPFKALGVKYIFDHHDANPELYEVKYGRRDFLYKIQLCLESATYKTSDVVIATNASYRERAFKLGGIKPDDIFIVRNGPDLKTFKPVPPNPALKYGKPHLVGYVGTMAEQEGIDILIEVAAHIRKLGREVHFTCVGSGPALESLRRLVHDKGLDDRFNFTGRVPDGELLEVLSTADVCVNPDRPCEMNDMSTMIKIGEYMALGKPIVQFDLKEGKFTAQEASLYASKDNQVADFADKVVWLLDHPNDGKRMGEIGRKRVQEALAWEFSVPHLLAAYDRAFAKSRKQQS
jgi:glycosyltransferase involved in cell wall biosynthesis